jgi:hypothetical protein
MGAGQVSWNGRFAPNYRENRAFSPKKPVRLPSIVA